MPSNKLEKYTSYQIENSKIGRAFAHPARIRIIEILRANTFIRNTDLTKYLDLTQPSISNHINKLSEAGLITTRFLSNSSTLIFLKEDAELKVKDFLEGLFEGF